MYTLTNIQSAVNMQMHVCNCCDELYFVVVCLLPNLQHFVSIIVWKVCVYSAVVGTQTHLYSVPVV